MTGAEFGEANCINSVKAAIANPVKSWRSE